MACCDADQRDPKEEAVDVGPSRRAVLAAGAAAVPLFICGCRGVQVLGAPPPPTPDVRLLRAAIAAERLMISRYNAATIAAAGNSAVAATLTGLRAEHEQHLAVLSSRLIEPGALAASPRASQSPITAGPGADLTATLAALAADEQAAAQRLATQLLAMPPSLAQVLASISASESTHVPVLDQLRRTA